MSFKIYPKLTSKFSQTLNIPHNIAQDFAYFGPTVQGIIEILVSTKVKFSQIWIILFECDKLCRVIVVIIFWEVFLMGQSRPLFLFLAFSHHNFNNTNWKKHRCCAWDSNLRTQDIRHRRNHRAMHGGHQSSEKFNKSMNLPLFRRFISYQNGLIQNFNWVIGSLIFVKNGRFPASYSSFSFFSINFIQ